MTTKAEAIANRQLYSEAELALSLIERASFKVPQFAEQIRRGPMSDDQRRERAMQVLEHLIECMDDRGADPNWWRDYYLLTGDHMQLTEEGWIPAEMNTRWETGEDPVEVLDEVNSPESAATA